jgi:NADPH2:quinone reductase
MTRIRTVRCHAISDDIGTVTLDQVELPPPAAGEVQVRLRACAVNFPDILMIQGKYQHKPELPFAPGGEASGDVAAVGAGVTQFRPGDPVVVGIRTGGFADAVNVPVGAVAAKPAGMDYDQAASFQTAYLTAYVALKARGHLEPGETLLVHGATGGVGLAAVDIGKLMGATVIATGGTDEKLAIVKARGADHVINYTLPDGRLGGFRDAVKALTGGRGADVVYDPVGGDVFDESMRCVNWNGRILVIGFTSGRWPSAPVNLVLIKHVSVIGVRAGAYGRRDPVAGARVRRELLDLANGGRISPYVCARFPLERAVDAMRMLVERKVVGKVVVRMDDLRDVRMDDSRDVRMDDSRMVRMDALRVVHMNDT